MTTPIDVVDIMKQLPHRYPFILVDRILELEPKKSLTALKNVTINEPFFQGHFPGMPVMPGVLIIEAMAQAGGILGFKSVSEENFGKPIYFMGMDKVRFRKPVVPGDQIIFDITMLQQRGLVMKMKGVALVDGQRAAEAELMATFGAGE